MNTCTGFLYSDTFELNKFGLVGLRKKKNASEAYDRRSGEDRNVAEEAPSDL